jgi:putative zinc finger protein
MSGNGNQHPARSVEFLSRLHDGDLDASERARFEAHRTHCAECRRAALEFEDAISLFRASRSTPPRADLAARILRKVQSTNRPRAPFSPRFRLDLTWAALLVTALLALLISTPIAVRRTPPTAPVAVDQAARTPAPAPTAPEAERATAPEIALRDRGAASGRLTAQRAPAPALRKEEQRRNVAEEPAAREKEAKAAEASADRPVDADERNDSLSRAVAAAESPALAAGGAEEPSASIARAVPLRLTVHSIDGYGAAPPLLSEGPVELSPQERGREYVLLLDSQGVVREVRPSPSPAALSRLHFRPGSRPRRLLVRVE